MALEAHFSMMTSAYNAVMQDLLDEVSGLDNAVNVVFTPPCMTLVTLHHDHHCKVVFLVKQDWVCSCRRGI